MGMDGRGKVLRMAAAQPQEHTKHTAVATPHEVATAVFSFGPTP